MEINEIEILSVGVDVGSSTSHLAFSKLLLVRDEASESRRFEIQERKVVYEGEIINTPFKDNDTIDIEILTNFLKQEYQHAGIDPADIQTGAVIVTGESAKKQNAKQIAEALSHDAGQFVAATAGPNFESLIAAMGSGATARSKDQNKTILSCDIGGGTSNMAISQNGEILSTSCISVGGRLLGVELDGKIWRMDGPAIKVMQHLGLHYQIGDQIAKDDLEKVVAAFTDVLLEVLTGPAHSPLAKQLMLTDDLDFPESIDEYSFSGGVAELMYGKNGRHTDIGQLLADNIISQASQLSCPVIEPINKIRATVIGAGAYSVSISGSSCFKDDAILFPIRNVPVIRVDVEREKLSIPHVIARINVAFQRFDMNEGDEVVALYFKDPVQTDYAKLELFARAIEAALPGAIEKKIPIILIFETDIARSVGSVICRETGLKKNLLSLDELKLKEGDWIDIGEPLLEDQVFPVTVKSLVFHGN
jgi:ethanolamine utilization protein EutA